MAADLYLQRALYVRACYPQLFEKLRGRQHVLLTGTPGIGKVGLSVWHVRNVCTAVLTADCSSSSAQVIAQL